MPTINDKQLEKIINDKTSGSTEILKRLNKYFLHLNKNRKNFTSAISIANKKLKHFAAIENYLKTLKKLIDETDFNSANDFLESYNQSEENKFHSIFIKIYNKLSSAENIITLSRSGTLLKVFSLWHRENKKFKITIMESRPSNEGILMAKDLLKEGIKVQLITDSMMSIFVPEADAAIIGADIILKNGNVVNKTGSKTLALLCRMHKKPFYVLSDKSKITNRKNYKIRSERGELIWDYAHPNLKIINYPFEEIEKKFITSIITD